MCNNLSTAFGQSPVNVKWNIVRGDTSTLKIEFFELDEVTLWDTDTWQFAATAYDPATDLQDDLVVSAEEGYITVTAPASITSGWGEDFRSIVAELQFDVQVIIPQTGEESIVWTPIVGTISVIGDVSGGL